VVTLPDDVRRLLSEPNIAFLATLMKDGAPQVTPVWIAVEGDVILVNTSADRQKSRNIERDPRVALSVTDRHDGYRWVSIRGRVVEVTTEGADALIDALAQKYLGQEPYPFRQPGEVRLILRIEAEAIATGA
jgi:PPOX class probable F420-dependent enzyme